MLRCPTRAPAAPPLHLLSTEPLRAAIEYAKARLSVRVDDRVGDGHLVVIFPGLAAGERTIEPLRAHCVRSGFDARGWGRGINRGPRGDTRKWLAELAGEIDAIAATHPTRSLSLIGWSLGGLYAREVAKLAPRRVRRVITLGSPVTCIAGVTHAEWLFRLLNPGAAARSSALERRLRAPPPVPTTSIYSRSDGVVAWHACVDDEAPHVEHVEVDSSHLGLVWHPDVLDIVADRLHRSAQRHRLHGDDRRRKRLPAHPPAGDRLRARMLPRRRASS